MADLTIIEQNGQRVLTTAQLAESYGADKQLITNNFNRNKERYKEGKHFIQLTGQQKNDFINQHQIDLGSKNAQFLYLWTEKGAWLHAKSLNTDQAWDAYEMLVDEYYKLAEQKPMTPSELALLQAQNMVALERKVAEQDGRIEKLEQSQKNMAEIVSLNSVEWRKKVTNIIQRIGTELGGGSFYQQIWKESYALLEQRAECKLGIRQTNKRRKMLEEGVAKSKIDKVSKLDVIADDSRLTEIYLAIVKEMAIKYDVEPND